MAKSFVLFGSPIDHSPSPAMHNAAFSRLGIDASYGLHPAGVEDLPEVLRTLRDGRYDGANITTPLKTHVAKHVELSKHAERAGAVNTVFRRNGELFGDLTDVMGIREPLAQRNLQPSDVLILGSGGATRAAVLALDGLSCRIHMAARRPEAAQELLRELAPRRPGETGDILDTEWLASLFGKIRLVLQATPVGRQGERHRLPWELGEDLVAFDMLYLPRQTPFLEDATQHGHRTIQGWEMLLAQGEAAFSLLAGQPAPPGVMAAALEQHLSQSEE